MKVVIFLTVSIFFILGCAKSGSKGGSRAEGVDFENQIQPIFNANCIGCHGENNPPAGLSLVDGKSYDNLVGVTSTNYGPALRVKPGFPDSSVLYHKITYSGAYGGGMPPGDRLDQESIDLIKKWIEELK